MKGITMKSMHLPKRERIESVVFWILVSGLALFEIIWVILHWGEITL